MVICTAAMGAFRGQATKAPASGSVRLRNRLRNDYGQVRSFAIRIYGLLVVGSVSHIDLEQH